MNDSTGVSISMGEEIAKRMQNFTFAFPKDEFSLVLLRGDVASDWLEKFAAMLIAAKVNALVVHTDDKVDVEMLSRTEAVNLIRGIALQVPDAVLADAGLVRIAR